MAQQSFWMHRITCGNNATDYAGKLLNGSSNRKEHYITIGWCDFSVDDYVKTIQQGGTRSLDKLMIEENYGLVRNRFDLKRFVAEMKKDDIVIVPQDGAFTVCRIADDTVLTNESIDKGILSSISNNTITFNNDGYLYNANGGIIDMGFYRRVEIMERNIPRCYASQRLYSALKYRGTNLKLSLETSEDIKQAVEAYRDKKPIYLTSVLEEKLAQATLDVINKQLNDTRFENLVEVYFKTIGARIEKPAKNSCPTAKGDADRIAYFDTINVQIMIQAKKHDGETGDWAVKQIKSYAENFDNDDYDTQLWVISSCANYSNAAVELAGQKGVRLISGIEFAKMLLEVGIKGLNV